jgi:hypothetical protein
MLTSALFVNSGEGAFSPQALDGLNEQDCSGCGAERQVIPHYFKVQIVFP